MRKSNWSKRKFLYPIESAAQNTQLSEVHTPLNLGGWFWIGVTDSGKDFLLLHQEAFLFLRILVCFGKI